MDRRTKRTRKWLQDALIKLLKEKSFDAITVQDLINEADIARMTFYRNYQDKEQLLQSCIDDFIAEIEPLLNPPLDSPENETGIISRENVERFYSYCQEHRERFKILLTSSVGLEFRRGIKPFIVKLIRDSLKGGGTLSTLNIPLDILVNFVAESTTGLLAWWLETDSNYSPKEMSNAILAIIEEGIFGVTKVPSHLQP